MIQLNIQVSPSLSGTTLPLTAVIDTAAPVQIRLTCPTLTGTGVSVAITAEFTELDDIVTLPASVVQP